MSIEDTTHICKEHASLPKFESRWAFPFPPQIRLTDIEDDGGRWIELPDGRIVEYFVCGSTSPHAKVLVDCHGGNCTGKFFECQTDWVEKCEENELNMKVISLSQPGFGYSTIFPGRKIGEWPMTDLLPVLQREKVKEFLVTGISFGTCHALAVAAAFASAESEGDDTRSDLPKCLGMGLRVPYMGSESCQRLELENHLQIGLTTKSVNTSFFGNIMARAFLATQEKPSDAFNEPGFLLATLMECFNPGSIENLKRLKQDYPKLCEATGVGMDRSVVNSTIGVLYNYCTDVLLDHGFDIQGIRQNLPIVIWYAKDDEDCPPSHGEYLASGKHFVKCKHVRVFEGYGHVGGAFVDHPDFLEQLVIAIA